MKVFKDNEGREWLISINIAAVKQCRALLGIDLYALMEDGFKGLGKLLGDPVSLVDVIYVLCRADAEKRGISDEAFGRAMAGDAIQNATTAFLDELTDFFPDPRVRTGLRRVIEKGTLLGNRMMDLAMQDLENLDIESEVSRLRSQSGVLPVSSASTQAP